VDLVGVNPYEIHGADQRGFGEYERDDERKSAEPIGSSKLVISHTKCSASSAVSVDLYAWFARQPTTIFQTNR
jgi:hypothetical protein